MKPLVSRESRISIFAIRPRRAYSGCVGMRKLSSLMSPSSPSNTPQGAKATSPVPPRARSRNQTMKRATRMFTNTFRRPVSISPDINMAVAKLTR